MQTENMQYADSAMRYDPRKEMHEAFYFFNKENESTKERISALEKKVDSNSDELEKIQDFLGDISKYSKWIARGVGFICLTVLTKIIEFGIENLF